MFKHIELGVGARGVSVAATKNIIDAVKVSRDSNISFSVDIFLIFRPHNDIMSIYRTSGCL